MFKKILCLALSFLFLIGIIMPIGINAANDELASELDYKGYGTTGAVGTMTISEIIEQLGNKKCTDGELAYLREKYGDLSLVYSCEFEDEDIQTSLLSNNSIKIEAEERTFENNNGKLLVWIPISASYRQKTVTLTKNSDGNYSGIIDGVEYDAKFYATVRYIAEIQVSNVVNDIVNEAYKKGFESKAILDEYALRVYNYESHLALYNQYVEDSNQYVIDLAKYMEDSEIYEKWLTDKALYELYLTKKAAFDKNEKLKNNYAEMYADWQKYVINKNLCVGFLTTFETIYEPKSELGTNGSSVSMSHMITGTGLKIVYEKVNAVDPSTLHLMFGNASSEFSNCESRLVVLTDLLNQYLVLETEEQKFNWYKENYAVYKENINSLYNSMNKIMNNKSFNWAMNVANLTPDQQERIKRFVFNLGAYNAALKDPTGYAFPEFVEEPGVPDYSMIEPYPVEDPGYMFEPIAPTEPSEVKHPGNAPEELIMSDIDRNIALEVEIEKLREYSIVRTSLTVIYDFPVAINDNKESIYITFMDYNGSIQQRIKYEPGFDVSSVVPLERTDVMYDYVFEGWRTSDGKIPDFDSLTSNISLFPSYSKNIKKFEITWVTGKGTFVTKCEYGVIPNYTGDTSKDADNDGTYTFMGWDKKLSPATTNETYVAQYSTNDITYTITWWYKDKSIVSKVVKGGIPVFPQEDPQTFIDSIDGIIQDKYSQFIGWDKALVSAYGDAEYHAITETKWVVPITNGTGGDLTMGAEVSSEKNEWKVKIRSDDADADLNYIIRRSLSENKQMVVEVGKDTIIVPAASLAVMANSTSFKYNSALTQQGYSINLDITDKDGNKVNVPGITVSFTFDIKGENYNAYKSIDGVTFEKCSYYDLGNGYLSFITDGSSILYKLEKSTEIITTPEYIIEFYSEGVLIKSEKYSEGSAVIPPVVGKEDDSKYHYTFIGWTPALIDVAISDAVYEAVYQKDLIKIGLPWFIIVAIILGALIVAGVAAIVVFKILKKKKKKELENTISTNSTKSVVNSEKSASFDTSNFGETLTFSLKENAEDDGSEKVKTDGEKEPSNSEQDDALQSSGKQLENPNKSSKTASKSNKILHILGTPFRKIRAKINELKKQVL